MTRSTILLAGTLAFAVPLGQAPVAIAGAPFPQYDQLGAARAAGENPYFHVNRYGYGNYVQGPNGAIGGYPAGSAGAIELENEHDIKCRYLPESC